MRIKRCFLLPLWVRVVFVFVLPLWAFSGPAESGKFKSVSFENGNGDSFLDCNELYHIERGTHLTKDEFMQLLDHAEFKSFIKEKGLNLRVKKVFEWGWFSHDLPEGVEKDVTIQLGFVNSATTSALQVGIINYGASSFGRFGCVNRLEKGSNSETGGVNIALVNNHIEGDMKGAAIALFHNYVDGDVHGLSTAIFASTVTGDMHGVLGSFFYNRIGGVSQGVLAGLFNYTDIEREGVTIGLLRNGTTWHTYIDWMGILTFLIFGSFLRFRSERKKKEDKTDSDGDDPKGEGDESPTAPDDDSNTVYPETEIVYPEAEHQAAPFVAGMDSSQQEMVRESVAPDHGIEKIPGGGVHQQPTFEQISQHTPNQMHAMQGSDALLNNAEANPSIEEMLRQ